MPLFIILVVMGIWFSMLRENGPGTPYSLGRTQMMVWTFIVFISYIFVFMITKDMFVLTAQVLILMGISGGAAIGAAIINTKYKDEKDKKLQEQLDAIDKLVSETKKEEANHKKLTRHKTNLTNIQNGSYFKDSNPLQLFEDILTDNNGYNLHRIQMFLWTFILVWIFISEIYIKMAMPEFDLTLLGLMGISSTTYLGFKVSE